MRKSLFLVRAALVLAMSLTFSCSSDDSSGGNDQNGGSSSSAAVSSSSSKPSSSSSVSSSSSAEASLSSSSSIVLSSSSTAPSSSSIYQTSDSCPNASTMPVDATGVGSVSCGGETYKTVKIGEQVWMARNLNYAANSSVCYGDQTGGDSQDMCGTYGRMYNWATAIGIPSNYNNELYNPSSNTNYRGVCPEGWHIPSDAEWAILMQTVNPSCIPLANCDGAGTKLKSASLWNSYNDIPKGTDDYGFTALPGGRYFDSDGFIGIGESGYWWSSTEYDADRALHRRMNEDRESVKWDANAKSSLFSVRCLKD